MMVRLAQVAPAILPRRSIGGLVTSAGRLIRPGAGVMGGASVCRRAALAGSDGG